MPSILLCEDVKPNPKAKEKAEKQKKRKSSNGSGGIRRRKDGSYEARIVVGFQENGKPKRVSIYGKTEKEVRLKLNKTVIEKEECTYCDKNNITFSGWLTEWLDTYAKPGIKPSTYTSYKTYITGHITPYFSNTKLQDLQPDVLQKFFNYKRTSGRLDGKEGGNSAKTILNIKNMIHAALNQAYINGIIPRNVADLVKAPKQTKKEMRVLTVDEQNALLNAAYKDRYGGPIIIALFTGMRVGEVLALKKEDIELESAEPFIHVRASIKRQYKDGYIDPNDELFNDVSENKTVLIRSTPKTYMSIRDIPLIPEVVEELKKQLLRIDEDKELSGEAYTDHSLVFANILGQPFDQRTYMDNFTRILKASGVNRVIQIGTNDVSAGFHTLRHTFATRAIENGMDILVLSRILGHTQPSTTLNKYGHVLSEHMRTSINKIRPKN